MLRLSAPGGRTEVRHVQLSGMAAGVPRDLALELVATTDHQTAQLAVTPTGWAEVSTDDGQTWDPATADPRSAADLGPIAAGARIPIILRVTVPTPAPRIEYLSIRLGEGV